MTSYAARPRRARLFLLVITVVAAVAGQAGAAPSGPVAGAPKKATSAASDAKRVIIYDGVTDAFLGSLGALVDYDVVYRYKTIAGAAVSVPAGQVSRVIEFARARGLKAEQETFVKADLNASTQTVYVKGAGNAWDLGYTGTGVTVAVLDTGIAGGHQGLNDLDDNPATSDPKILAFRDFVNGGTAVPAYDDHGHGSHTSGIAGGTGQGSSGTGPGGKGHVGVAYGANLVGLKVLDSGGSGSSTNIVAAIDWMAQNANSVNPPIRVANYSIGPRTVVPGSNNGSSAQAAAMNRAVDAGIVFVQSGGNGTSNGLLPNQTAGNVGGDALKTIAVCSSNSAAPPTAPTYSSWDSEGPTADGRPKPEVCAPGDSVMSADHDSQGYVSFGGTSMSSPHVAGVAALIIQAVPAITPAQVKQVIIETALEYANTTPYDPYTQNNGWNGGRGWGEVRARQAIQLAITRYGGPPQPLSVVSGGPYTAIQGETRTLSASATNGRPPYSFAWDLDNNGTFETNGQTASFSDTSVPGDKLVQVRATDSVSATSTTTTVVTVLEAINVFADNVEGADDNGWVSNDPTGWHRTTVRAQSPTRSWYPGNDITQLYQPLANFTLTRTIDLSTGPAATAGQLLYQFSRSGDMEIGFDKLTVQVKKSAAATWTNLAVLDDELGATWANHSLDITSFKGFSTDLRFLFTSDEIVEFSGPFIDDIKIIGSVALPTDAINPDPILDLVAGTAAMGSVPLTWTATGDDGASGTASSYDLRYGTSPITAANFALATPVAGTPAPKPAGGAESFTVSGLSSNTTYYFAIKAIDEASNAGLISNVVSATTLADLIAPSKVLNLTGAAGNSLVSLSWSAATDNVGVTGYDILRDGTVASTTSSTSAILTGLTNGTTYQFRVRAKDAAANVGVASDPLGLTPIAPSVIAGWPESRGGSARTGTTGGRGSIAVPAIRQTLSIGSPVDASPLLVDLDGDADMDMVVVTDATATAPTVVRAFRQTPTGLVSMWAAPYSVPLLTGQNDGFGNIAVGQLNGGGPLEVAVYSNNRVNAQAASTNEGRLAVLNATTGALIDDLSVVAGNAESLVIGVDTAPAIGDVDGDGNAEIILIHHVGGTTPGSFVAAIGLSGSTLVEKFDTNITTTSNWTSLALAELRPAHSGLEIVAGQNAAFVNAASTGAVRVCKPIAGNAVCDENISTTTGILGLSVADLDGDSQPEIVANGRTGSSLNVIKTSPSLSLVSRADGTLWNTASLADIDGDGKADIVNAMYSATGTGFPEWDPEKKGNVTVRGFTGSAIVLKGTLARVPTPGSDFGVKGGGALADIAGTTRPEFVFGSADGSLNAVSLGATPASLWSIPLGSAAGAPVAVGDVTGDGLLDLVAGTAGGNVVVVGAGPIASLTITPTTSTIAAGGSQTYTTEGFDSSGNPLGDVTQATAFSIVGGNCTGSTCTSTAAGNHTVTATLSGKSATATLTVTTGPLDAISISPATATIVAGGGQNYTTTGRDQYGNSLGDVTASTVFTIAPNGSCTVARCGATAAGPHTVTATTSGKTAQAALTVNAGALNRIVLTPSESTIAVTQSQTYTAEGRDFYDNSLGNVTAMTTFTIAPNGSCAAATCSATAIGDHTVTARNGVVMATATLHVIADVIDHIVLSPASATITAGGSQAYTAEGFAADNTSLGDVTSSTVFSISPNGTCSGNVCTATLAGAHTVTGRTTGVSATAALQVVAGPTTSLTLFPPSSSIVTGGSRTYTATGRDQYGNITGDVTASTVFTIAPDGSCTANKCTASVVGPHTVTGVNGTATATASLQVLPASPVIITPAAGSLQPAQAVISGTAPTGSTVDVYEGTTKIVAGASVGTDGTWSVTRAFGTGPHTITANAVVGTSTSAPSAARSFTVDATPPTVTISKPSGYLLFAVYGPFDTVKMSGIARDGQSLVDRVEITYSALLGADVTGVARCTASCSEFRWQHTPALAPDIYTVSAVAIDRAGNRSSVAAMDIVTLSLVSSGGNGTVHGRRSIQ